VNDYRVSVRQVLSRFDVPFLGLVASCAAVVAGAAVYLPSSTQWVFAAACIMGGLSFSRTSESIYKLPIFALIAFAPFTDYGPDPITVGTGLVLLAAPMIMRVRGPSYFGLAGGLLVVAVLTSFMSSGGDLHYYGTLATAIAAYVVLNRLFTRPDNRGTAYAAISVLMLWSAALALLQTQGFNPVESLHVDPLGYAASGRVSAAFPQPIAFGIAGALGLFLLWEQPGRLARAGKIAAVLCVVLAQTRTVVLAVVISLLVQFLRGAGRRVRLVAAVAVIAICVWALQDVTTEAGTSIYSSFAKRLSGSAVETGTNQRVGLWEATMRMVEDHPFGVGWGQYSDVILQYDPYRLSLYFIQGRPVVLGGAESLYLQMLAELGWFGLAAVVALIAKGLWASRRAPYLFSFWIVVAVTAVTAQSLLAIAVLFTVGAALTANRVEGASPGPGAPGWITALPSAASIKLVFQTDSRGAGREEA
jgi:hypothetical protein